MTSLLACLVLAACTTSRAGRLTSPSPPPRGHTGGTLTLGVANPVYFGMDPQNEWAFGSWELYRCCLLRTLMSYRGTTGFEGTDPQPDLASAPPDVSADELTWTFHLRSGLHYAPPMQDVPITSNDIVRAILRAGDPTATGNSLLGKLYLSNIDGYADYAAKKADSISGLETPDPLTLRVHEVRPDVTLPYVFGMAMTAPIPPSPTDPSARLGVATGHARRFNPSYQGGYGQFLVASGPYMIEGADAIDFTRPPRDQTPASGFVPWRFDEDFNSLSYGSITMVRNPSWDPATDGLRAALPDRIVIQGGDKGDLYRRYAAGELAMVYDSAPPQTMLKHYLDDPSLRPLVQTLDTDNVMVGAFNLGQPPFDDIEVRRAVAYALDRRPLAAAAGPGYGFGAAEVAGHYVNDSAEGSLASGWDPLPGADGAPDLAAAHRAMSSSRYGEGGRCVDPVCRDVVVLLHSGLRGQEATVRRALNALGIEGTVRATDAFYDGDCQDPRVHAGMCVGDAWFPDFPSAGNTLTSMFAGQDLTGEDTLTHLGASPDQLAELQLPVRHVPTIDPQIVRCNEHAGSGQIACWTRLDQYLVTQVMPSVPIAFIRIIVLSSPSIASFSWDQATQAPALDRLEVASG